MITSLPPRVAGSDAPKQVSQKQLTTPALRAPDLPPASTRPIDPIAALARQVPFTTVRIPGCSAEILLPTGGGEPAQAWPTYLAALEHSATFTRPAHDLPPVPHTTKEKLVAAEWRQTLDDLEALHALQNLGATVTDGVDDRPVVGILIADVKRMLPGNHTTTMAIIHEVEAMGCRPLLIPPRADLVLPQRRVARWAGIVAMAQQLHGLVGPGGADVHPHIYLSANKPHPKTGEPMCHNPIYPRDRFEADVALAAMDSEIFCFGICRSHQLWNAVRGRSMVQDVEAEGYSFITQDMEELGLPRSQTYVATKDGVTFENRVHLNPTSRLAREVNGDSMVTDSLHHQAVGWGIRKPSKELRAPIRPQLKRLRVVGHVLDPVTRRRTIEACEDWNVFTTQFHPEPRPEDSVERHLFEVVGRRARIFKLVRDLRAAGDPLTSNRILDAMGTLPEGTFTNTDREWVRADLVPHLKA